MFPLEPLLGLEQMHTWTGNFPVQVCICLITAEQFCIVETFLNRANRQYKYFRSTHLTQIVPLCKSQNSRFPIFFFYIPGGNFPYVQNRPLMLQFSLFTRQLWEQTLFFTHCLCIRFIIISSHEFSHICQMGPSFREGLKVKWFLVIMSYHGMIPMKSLGHKI